MKFGILTPIWKRPALTRLFLDYYTSMLLLHGFGYNQEQSFEHLCVVSPGDKENADLPKLYPSVHFVSAPNMPLSDKHNIGMQALREYDLDAVLLIPSDDFFTASYFYEMAKALDEGHDAARVEALYFYDPPTDRLLYGSHLGTGAGFMFSRDLLNRIEWQAWRPGGTSGMDNNMFSKIVRPTRNCKSFPGMGDFVGVDIKGPESLNHFDIAWNSKGSWTQQPAGTALSFFTNHFPALATYRQAIQ